MIDAAFIRALRGFSRRKPFRAFILEFHTGERLAISHPEAIDVQGDTVVYRGVGGLYRLFDASSVCQLMDIPKE